MADEGKFLVDVGMRDLPFPMRVMSKRDPDGQHTVANISITARIMQAFEARWINKFIQIVHAHRERIGTRTLAHNIVDYMNELKASSVRIDFDYPYFVEKQTPVSKETCLVRYLCTYSAKAVSGGESPRILFKIEAPCITTFPGSSRETPTGLFGQLSVVSLEVELRDELFPEDLVSLVDECALAPMYSFLSEEDQAFLIEKIHSEAKTSVVMIDEIKRALAHRSDVAWYAVRCANFGMLHSYSTVIGTEKSSWVPFSGYDDEI